MAGILELRDHLLHEPAAQVLDLGPGLGGEQDAAAAELVGPFQQLQVAEGGPGGRRGDLGLQVDGGLAAGLGGGDHVAVAVALAAEGPVELANQLGQGRGAPASLTDLQLDADQLQLPEQGVVVGLEGQVAVDRHGREADGAQPLDRGRRAAGGWWTSAGGRWASVPAAPPAAATSAQTTLPSSAALIPQPSLRAATTPRPRPVRASAW